MSIVIAFCIGFSAGVVCTILLLLLVIMMGDYYELEEESERGRLMTWPFRKNNVVEFKRPENGDGE